MTRYDSERERIVNAVAGGVIAGIVLTICVLGLLGRLR